MKPILTLSLVLIFFTSVAQSSRVQAVNLQADSKNQVLVEWVISPGSTCNAPQVQHSLDGKNFTTIYTYPGVCGGTDEAESYSWVHSNPEKYRLNYYRLFLDQGELTLAEVIDLQSNLAESLIWIYPNPIQALNQITLELRNENLVQFSIRLLSTEGKVVYEKNNQNGVKLSFEFPKLKAGKYWMEIRFENGITESTAVSVY